MTVAVPCLPCHSCGIPAVTIWRAGTVDPDLRLRQFGEIDEVNTTRASFRIAGGFQCLE
jgi:hypothetical protein